jgi:putative transposase
VFEAPLSIKGRYAVTQDNIVKFAEQVHFEDPLTEVLRSGARKLLADAVEAEVSDFLDRHSRFLTEEGQQRLVRHRHLPERDIMTGIGPVGVRAPNSGCTRCEGCQGLV